MLVYKFCDVFSSLRTKKRCADCKIINTCYWHKRRKNPMMDACGEIKISYRNQDVTPNNASWLLFQIGRDMELSKNVIIQRQNNIGYMLLCPPQMRTNHLPSFIESELYVKILAEYMRVLGNFEKSIKGQRNEKAKAVKEQEISVIQEKNRRRKASKEVKLRKLEEELKQIDASIGRFVSSIIETTLKVKNEQIAIYSDGEDLIDATEKIAKEYNVKVYRTKNYEEAKAWVGQITSAS